MPDEEERRWEVRFQLGRLVRDPEYQEFMRRNADESGVYHTSATLDDEPAREVVQRVLARYEAESASFPILLAIPRESTRWGVVFLRFEPASPLDHECPITIDEETTVGMLYDALAPSVLPIAEWGHAVRVQRAGALADCA